MTTRKVLAAGLLCAASVHAEQSFGARGQVVPFGGIGLGYSSSNGVSETALSLSPGALWFFADGFAVGAQAHLGWHSGTTTFAVSTPAVTTVGAAPEVAAVLPLGDRVAFFPQIALGVSYAFASGSSAHGVALDGFAPIVFTPVPHLFLGFGPSLAWVVEASSGAGSYSLGVTSQIGGWF